MTRELSRAGPKIKMPTIYVINPNSTEAITAAIDEALEPLRSNDGPEIECLDRKSVV